MQQSSKSIGQELNTSIQNRFEALVARESSALYADCVRVIKAAVKASDRTAEHGYWYADPDVKTKVISDVIARLESDELYCHSQMGAGGIVELKISLDKPKPAITARRAVSSFAKRVVEFFKPRKSSDAE